MYIVIIIKLFVRFQGISVYVSLKRENKDIMQRKDCKESFIGPKKRVSCLEKSQVKPSETKRKDFCDRRKESITETNNYMTIGNNYHTISSC